MSKRITELKKLLQMAEARMDEARKGANGEPTRAYQEAIRDYRVLAKRLMALETAAIIKEGVDDLKAGRVSPYSFDILKSRMSPEAQEEVKVGTKKLLDEYVSNMKPEHNIGRIETLEDDYTMVLSKEDSELFIDMLLNPPEPNEKLKALMTAKIIIKEHSALLNALNKDGADEQENN